MDEELVVPAATAAFHGEAVFAEVLFEQGEREAIQPGDVRAQVAVAEAGLVFAVGQVEAPRARVLEAQWLRTARAKRGTPSGRLMMKSRMSAVSFPSRTHDSMATPIVSRPCQSSNPGSVFGAGLWT